MESKTNYFVLLFITIVAAYVAYALVQKAVAVSDALATQTYDVVEQ